MKTQNLCREVYYKIDHIKRIFIVKITIVQVRTKSVTFALRTTEQEIMLKLEKMAAEFYPTVDIGHQ